jgi:hypothetical protein
MRALPAGAKREASLEIEIEIEGLELSKLITDEARTRTASLCQNTREASGLREQTR